MMKNVLVSLDKLDMASPSRGTVSPCLRFWFLNPIACQVSLHCIIYHVISYSCFVFYLRNHLVYPYIFSCCLEKLLHIFFLEMTYKARQAAAFLSWYF
jgi:hypothetical protein